ncbi:hypothetical protein [Campylobacter sp. RM15925]|uniref:hypothetical protein n=1 Tax=Campylobacter sp. RM15925 TaxID=1705724 RepID=UPI0014762567|nr:hypothetical protein [Campylobacter sp. RM15925]
MKNEDELKIKIKSDKKAFLTGLDTTILVIAVALTFLFGEGFPIIYLMIINLVICFIYANISIFKKLHHSILFTVLIILHLLLLFNVQGWNEGSMSGSYYYIELLKPASDLLYGLLLVSAFTFCLPLIFYILFLNSLAKLTHYLSNPDKFKPKEELNKKQ